MTAQEAKIQIRNMEAFLNDGIVRPYEEEKQIYAIIEDLYEIIDSESYVSE